MGKGKKRKNPGVGVDFRKVKHKVGKKLPKAQNETRTDFQARSINLPNQSITQDKAGAAVSERNLTLKVGWVTLVHQTAACMLLGVYTAAAAVVRRLEAGPGGLTDPPAACHRSCCRSWHTTTPPRGETP